VAGGAPKGNRNGAKAKMWEGAIRRAINEDRAALADIAKKVLAEARAGEPWAITELRNTLDGKPKEHVQVEQNVNVNVGAADSLEVRLRERLTGSVRGPVPKPAH